jgi:tRNA A-37 threonylcarbamoyl transferase component Bud32
MTDTPQRCHVCDAELESRGKYCPECGAARTVSGTATAEHSGTSAAELHRGLLRRALGDAYTLGDLIGRGGFAEVYAARDVRLKRDVAVKTLRYDLRASAVLLERFRREAEAMAQLRHPHVMPIYTVGEAEGLAYFVMPLVRGDTLGQRMKREGLLPIPVVQRIVFEVASALEHAHTLGMVHRDVKPENILLEGDGGRVLVTDFGIARAAEARNDALTGTGIILGTPDYMSPEQASEARELDHRSDLYSLGVVAYQMLTGELPIRASSLQGFVVKLITEEPPSVLERRRDCPPELAALVARCLAKEPDDRFAAAAEVCALLGPAGGEPSALRHTPSVRGAIRSVAAAGATPVSAFRRSVMFLVIGSLALLAVDLATNGSMEFAPVIVALWCLPIASRYGRLWTDGYTWTDILRGSDGTPSGAVSSESGTHGARTGTFGSHTGTVQQVRSERAVIAGLVSNMPRVERDRIPGVVGTADRLVARARSLGRQLHRLDRVLDEDTAGSLGAVTTQRQRGEVETRREAMTGELTVVEAVIGELRSVVERVAAMGVSETTTDLDVAVRKANDVARAH